MIDDVEHPPANRPPLADGVGHPVGPEAPGNRHRRHIRVPGVARIFRYDLALFAGIVVRWIWWPNWILLQDPLNSRLANVDTSPRQLVGDFGFS